MKGYQKRYLRGLGHSLRPLVQIGKASLTANVIKQIDDNLVAHELIKVKLPQLHSSERNLLAEQISQSTSAQAVQVLGNTALFYRAHPDKPKIKLPTKIAKDPAAINQNSAKEANREIPSP
jgi:RNA-binding protein